MRSELQRQSNLATSRRVSGSPFAEDKLPQCHRITLVDAINDHLRSVVAAQYVFLNRTDVFICTAVHFRVQTQATVRLRDVDRVGVLKVSMVLTPPSNSSIIRQLFTNSILPDHSPAMSAVLGSRGDIARGCGGHGFRAHK